MQNQMAANTGTISNAQATAAPPAITSAPGAAVYTGGNIAGAADEQYQQVEERGQNNRFGPVNDNDKGNEKDKEKDKTLLYVGIGFLVLILIFVIIKSLNK